VGRQDVQRWIALLLGRYSAAYASNQYRVLQQLREITGRDGAVRPSDR
jgi:hypothetical protein